VYAGVIYVIILNISLFPADISGAKRHMLK